MGLRQGVTVLNWPATILTAESTIVATTRNVSEDGAYIIYETPCESSHPIDLHTRVGLIIRPPNRLPLLLRAEVTWSDVLSSDEKNILVGVGLQFLEVHHENRQFLQKLSARYCRVERPHKSSVSRLERRVHARVQINWPVKIITPHGTVEGRIKNISKGGALINCHELPVTEDSFKLGIEIAERGLAVAAEVRKVRLTIDESDFTAASYELAVRFVNITPEQRKILQGIIRYRNQLA
ncbi:MAG: PilZ domain-containing protein [Deltaproteobacteria bacterium]|nr:PilZ domain-containing protein [Deltaproteobacteria bacterium]